MYDRKWLTTHIVRLGERFPNRVGLNRMMRTIGCTDHCIAGQIHHDTVGCADPGLFWLELGKNGCNELIAEMVNLNNGGVKWGEIPIRLGLVPGEQPAESEKPALAMALEAVHA